MYGVMPNNYVYDLLSNRIIGIVDTVGLKLVIGKTAETLLSPSLSLSVEPADGTNFQAASFSVSDPNTVLVSQLISRTNSTKGKTSEYVSIRSKDLAEYNLFCYIYRSSNQIWGHNLWFILKWLVQIFGRRVLWRAYKQLIPLDVLRLEKQRFILGGFMSQDQSGLLPFQISKSSSKLCLKISINTIISTFFGYSGRNITRRLEVVQDAPVLQLC